MTLYDPRIDYWDDEEKGEKMPSDASAHMFKLFMVELIHMRSGKIKNTLGPYSENQAKAVTKALNAQVKENRGYFAATRRATAKERGEE